MLYKTPVEDLFKSWYKYLSIDFTSKRSCRSRVIGGWYSCISQLKILLILILKILIMHVNLFATVLLYGILSILQQENEEESCRFLPWHSRATSLCKYGFKIWYEETKDLRLEQGQFNSDKEISYYFFFFLRIQLQKLNITFLYCASFWFFWAVKGNL